MAVMRVCRMYVVGNGSLIITSALENDSAVYQCFAVNDVGETSATVQLTVFSKLCVCSCLLLAAFPIHLWWLGGLLVERRTSLS